MDNNNNGDRTFREMMEGLVEQAVENGRANWMKAISEIDPELAKPEYWEDPSFMEQVVFENEKVHKLIHGVLNTIALVPSSTEGSMAALYLLGYLAGRRSVENAN